LWKQSSLFNFLGNHECAVNLCRSCDFFGFLWKREEKWEMLAADYADFADLFLIRVIRLIRGKVFGLPPLTSHSTDAEMPSPQGLKYKLLW
jgi:hypothetical protein